MASANLLGNAQGSGARCTTIQRRRSFLPAGCTYDPTTGLPPCNEPCCRGLFAHPLNYNPVTGEQFRVLDPRSPASRISRAWVRSVRTSRIAAGRQPAIDYNSPCCRDGADPGEPAGYAVAAVCGNDTSPGWTKPARLHRQHRALVRPDARWRTTAARRASRAAQAVDRPGYIVNPTAALAGEPGGLRAFDPERLHPRSHHGERAGQGVVLGHATRQRRRAGLRVVPFQRGRRHAPAQPAQPGPPGRRHAPGTFRNRHLARR